MPITETESGLVLSFGKGSPSGMTLYGNSKTLSPAGIGVEASGFGTSVARTIINNEGKSSFLQLLQAGAQKVATGETTLTWTSSTQSATKEVKHGLEGKPTFVGLCLEAVTGTTIIGLRSVERSASMFKVFGNASSELNLSLTVLWIAIG